MRADTYLSVMVVSLFTVGHAAPHDRKPFHEHIEDFVGLFIAESGLQLERLLRQYGESKEFGITANYLRTSNFRDVLHEVESLPEFQAVIEYLEKADMDINDILAHINELVEHNEKVKVKPKRHKDGVMDMTGFLRESLNIFPKKKLAELFEQKKKTYSNFRHSMEKLESEEWQQIYGALLESQNFKKAEITLAENGLDVRLFIEHIKALFGQN